MKKAMCLILCFLVVTFMLPGEAIQDTQVTIATPPEKSMLNDPPMKQPIVSDLTSTSNKYSGPFIDEVLFKSISDVDIELAAALWNNEVDLVNMNLDRGLFAGNASIDYVNHTRYGYGWAPINCEKYPLNITAFRRALNFAIDKYNITNYVLGGMGRPLDAAVPPTNPYSIEGQLPYSYYAPDVALGNQMLDAAGFTVNVSSGFRLAPDGYAFDVEVAYYSPSAINTNTSQIIIDTLRSLSINATDAGTSDWPALWSILSTHGDYDIACMGWVIDGTNLDFLAEYTSDKAVVTNRNAPNFKNASYDAWTAQLHQSTDFNDVATAASELQKILAFECPFIVTYDDYRTYPYRTDVFRGFVDDITRGIPTWWTSYRARDIDEEYGGTLRWGMDYNISSFNPMDMGAGRNILEHMYDSLVTVDPEGYIIPWLAESWTVESNADNGTIPVGHRRFTFDLIQNATWIDGTPLTADDVVFTMQFYQGNVTNPYYSELQNMTMAYKTSDYTAVFEFNSTSYWDLTTVGYLPIIPKHVFQAYTPAEWADYDPDPRTDLIVTSGPFNITEWVPDDYVKMSYNPTYFYSTDRLWLDQDTDNHFQEESAPNVVTWSPYADDPSSYVVYRDGVQIASNPWTGVDISVTANNLEAGTYNYTLVIFDSQGHSYRGTRWVFMYPDISGTIVFDYSHGQSATPEAVAIDLSLEAALVDIGFTVVWAEGGLDSTILSNADALILGAIAQPYPGYSGSEITDITNWFLSGDKVLWVGADSDYSVWEHINSNMSAVLQAVGSHVYPEPVSVVDPYSNAGLQYRVIANTTSSDPYTMQATIGSDRILMHGPTVLYGSDSATPGVGVSPVALESISMSNVYPLLYYGGSAEIFDSGGMAPYAHSNASTGSFVCTTLERNEELKNTLIVSGAGPYGDYRPMTAAEHQGYRVNGYRFVRQLITYAIDSWYVPPSIDNPSDLNFDFDAPSGLVTWNPSDKNPDHYEILTNGSTTVNGTWNGGSISFELTSLEAGDNNLTIVVYDTNGNHIEDTVWVSVVHMLYGSSDISYDEENPGDRWVVWHYKGPLPAAYEVTRNSQSVSTNYWNSTSENLTLNVGRLGYGVHSFTLAVTYMVDTFTDTILVNVSDTTPPVLNHPSDVNVTNVEGPEWQPGDPEVSIYWYASDRNPDTYEIYDGGTLVESGNWWSQVVFGLGGLSVGTHNLRIVVYDRAGNSVEDTVVATIRASTTGTGTGTLPGPGTILTTEMMIAGGTLAGVVLVAIIASRRRKPKPGEPFVAVPPTVPPEEPAEGVQVLRGCAPVGGKFEYKVKIKNDSEFVINNVTVTIVAYPEDCMELPGETMKKLARIEPGGFRSPQFTFIPTKDCVEGQILSSVSFVNHRNKLEVVEVEPYLIRSVCDLLEPLESTIDEFELLLGDMSASREETVMNWNPEVLFQKVSKFLPMCNFYVIESQSGTTEGLFRGTIRGLAEGKYTRKKIAVRIVISGPDDAESSKVVIEGLGEDAAMLPTTIDEITKGIDAWICMNCGAGLEPEEVTLIKQGQPVQCKYCSRTLTLDLFRK